MMRGLLLRTPVLLAALAAAPAAPAPKDGPATPPAVRVQLVEPVVGGVTSWVAASLAAVHSATISTRLSATVRTLRVDEGTHVRRGDVLLTLSDADVRAQLAAAETALANTTANERRMSQLAAQRAATPVELEAAQAQRAQAAAGVAAARASLAYMQIRAPFDGIVQARRVSAGDLVGPGQPLLDIQGAALEVRATLSEAESKGLRIGQRLAFESEGHRGEVEITALTPGGDPLSHRRSVRAQITGSPQGFRSGTFARLALPLGEAPERTWIPRTALVERGDLTGVFLAESGHARLRWVSVGERLDDRVAIRAGISPGDQVIDSPGALRDEQPVEVARGGK